MSSLAPLMGRLSQVFSPRLCMFISTVIIAAGTLIVATSKTFEMFIVGRVISGAGASGIFIVASIITIQMTSPERRGLFIGLVNTGMTAGVSLGAVIAGALESKIGWVSHLSSFSECKADSFRNRCLVSSLHFVFSLDLDSFLQSQSTTPHKATNTFSTPSARNLRESTTPELCYSSSPSSCSSSVCRALRFFRNHSYCLHSHCHCL